MGPSAELACCGVDGRSHLLMVPASLSAKTRVLGTKGIIQPLGAEHWQLCFMDYLKPEIFRGQQPSPTPVLILLAPLGQDSYNKKSLSETWGSSGSQNWQLQCAGRC